MTYLLVMFDINRAKGVSNAMQKTIMLDDANRILGDANATIFCDRGKYVVVEKRLFIQKETETLTIICDVEKQIR